MRNAAISAQVWVPLATAALLVCIGLLTMLGWHLHYEMLIRLRTGWPPMRYNTALAFVAIGIAAGAAAVGRPRLARGLALLVAALAVLVLAQYALRLDFRIDQLLMHDYLEPEMGRFPGRMAPATAVCFLLAAAALLCGARRGWRATAAAMLVTLVAAQALGVLFSFALGVGAAYQHHAYVGMALHTALLFFAISNGLLVRIWIASDAGAPRWLSAVIGLGGLSFTLALWQGLQVQEDAALQRLLSTHVIAMCDEVEKAIAERSSALRRMARRWETRGGTPRGEWEADAAEYLHDYPSLLHLDWIDASNEVRWVMPRPDVEPQIASAAGIALIRADGVSQVRAYRQATASNAVPLRDGTAGFFMSVSLMRDGAPDGMLRALFRSNELLQLLLSRRLALGYQIRVSDGAHVLFEHRSNGKRAGRSAQGWADTHGVRWLLQLYPTPFLIEESQTPLPQATLLGGSVLSLLLVFTIDVYLKSRRQHTQLVRREARLAESEEKYRSLLNSLDDGVLVAQDERMVFANRAMSAMLGYTHEEMVNLTFPEFVAPESLDLIRTRYRQRILAVDRQSSEPLRRYEVECLKKGGAGTVWADLYARPTIYDERPAVLGIIRDITAHKAAIEQARLTSERLELVAQGAVDGIWDWSLTSGAMFLSPRWYELLGYADGELPATVETWMSRMHPDDMPWVREKLRRHLEEQEPYDVEYRMQTKRGEYRWYQVRAQAKRDADGRPLRLAGSLADISTRKLQEHRLEEALKEKETLLKEVYHRVKNNLQVIRSLLNLQSRSLPPGEARTALAETGERVGAMALVHEKLYRSGSLSAINLPEYVAELLKQLADSSAARLRGIELLPDIDLIEIGLDVAIPLGLLINELVSNSLKHAFPDARSGRIVVQFRCGDGGRTLLTVADDGIGLPSGLELDPLRAASMGLKLAGSLARQLGGQLTSEAAGSGAILRVSLGSLR